MKFLFLLSTAWLFTFCQKAEKSGTFQLLPVPQEFNVLGDSRISAETDLRCFSEKDTLPIGIDLKKYQATNEKDRANLRFAVNPTDALPDEGYLLNIDKEHISISSKDKAGLFYAFATLSQLLQDAGEQGVPLPMCQIKDYPRLSYRAVHLDVKHHLETLDYYYKLMDKLAAHKINAVILEFEDKLKYQKHPLVASDDALSAEGWIKLSGYARDRHISISPLVQGLGHASYILKHKEYENLRDDPRSDWAFNPLDPQTYELQFDLYREAIAATPDGKFLHVGGDEVHTNGRNSKKTPLELQLIWLEKVCKFAEENGRTPIFWDDMPLTFSGVYDLTHQNMPKEKVDSIWGKNEPNLVKLISRVPKNLVFMRWNYKSPTSYGNLKLMEWYRQHGFRMIGATAGQTRWVLMPQDESNIKNIKDFAFEAASKKSEGLLLTLWDDDSPLFELYHRGILAFAEYTWAGDKRDIPAYKAAYRQREFGYKFSPEAYAFIDSLEKPVAFWKNQLLLGDSRNYLKKDSVPAKRLIPLPSVDSMQWSKAHKALLLKSKQMLETNKWIAERIKILKSQQPKNLYLIDVYEVINDLTAFSSSLLLDLEKYDAQKNADEKESLRRKLKQAPQQFEALTKRIRSLYGQIRLLDKPANYILDQDHHVHLGNQAIRFEDWQFYAEELFLESLKNL